MFYLTIIKFHSLGDLRMKYVYGALVGLTDREKPKFSGGKPVCN
jgi:hypothetical protein